MVRVVKLYEDKRDLTAAVLGVIDGAGRRGLSRREVHLLTFMVAHGVGRVGEWGFEASEDGPRSKLVDSIVDELYDDGVVTLRFERRLGGEALYVPVEVEKLPWVKEMIEYQVGRETSESLMEVARLSTEELETLVYLLAPQYFAGRGRERIEARKLDTVARLVHKGVLSLDMASSLSGLDRRSIEERVEELKRSEEEILALLEAGGGESCGEQC